MRLTVFASGSTGNCALAEAGDARILIDDGISLRRLRGFLAAMGLSFFDPARCYNLSAPDENGIVEASSWCGEEGPDEDGFGREECYDWWYLDRSFRPIPGIEGLHGYSSLDMRAASTRKMWAELRQKAAKAVRRSPSGDRALPTEQV